MHLVSASFGALFRAGKDAVVAQLVRAPVCGTGGRWFEPTQLYQHKQALKPDFKNQFFPENGQKVRQGKKISRAQWKNGLVRCDQGPGQYMLWEIAR
jgi:hypothetical protein